MNISWSKKILRELAGSGVADVVFCAGARNSPLIATLAKTRGLNLHSFFEERSAAFFALGIARRTSRPVAIITTSGTATAELLPAVVEAFHTGVPLILVTADRPRRLRGSGAPQAIDQIGLYGKYVGAEFDLENGESFSLLGLVNRRLPIHVNICFDEPLIDEPVTDFTLAPADFAFHNNSRSQIHKMDDLQSFLLSGGPLIAVVGTLETAREREAVKKFLIRFQIPVYLEATSGLREARELQEISFQSGDRILNWGLRKELFSRVLRIGGVPTVRMWRDLEEPTCSAKVFSLSSLNFSGLSQGQFHCADIAETLSRLSEVKCGKHPELFAKDRKAARELERWLLAEPQSEPGLFFELSKRIPHDALIYVGNSLPIREWDFAAVRDHVRAVEANRGVNGIDGQTSTFIGLADSSRENWAILGDLTALYDMTGPWALRSREKLCIRIVVVNNSGGKIFQRIFGDALFENRHQLDFSQWAAMWNLSYQKHTSIPGDLSLDNHQVIELTPNNEATLNFWKSYDAFWVSSS